MQSDIWDMMDQEVERLANTPPPTPPKVRKSLKGLPKTSGPRRVSSRAGLAGAGAKFGRWTVIGEAGVDGRGRPLIRCRCACGREAIKNRTTVTNGGTLSCGCLSRDRSVAARERARAEVGMRFGEWTLLLGPIEGKRTLAGNRHPFWWCQCSCGTKRLVAGRSLAGRLSKDCGCVLYTLPAPKEEMADEGVPRE